ncbi:MAG: hypothetical protein RRA92_04630 [Gemmatimonadota bacterium]|nr:hypothetical protein [Gemmatimonadota bacterium]
MARHNREALGLDQQGEIWKIGYQPDWLSRLKVSRRLPGGRRRSSLTLFRNPARRAEAEPGRTVRTDIRSADGAVRFRIAVDDPGRVIEEVIVVTRPRRKGRGSGETVRFALESRLPPPRR